MAAHLNDETARGAVELILANVPKEDMSEEAKEAKWLVSQGELMELPITQKLLVKRLSSEPDHREDRNPGKFERLLGEKPVRTYVPLLFRPWVMDCTHKGAVHLGEKITLALLQRFYWWIGMADSVKWWIRRCYTCQARKSARSTIRWPLVSLPLPSRPGQMVSFDLLVPLPETKNGNAHVLLVVEVLSRHAEEYTMTKDEKTAKGCASQIVDDYIPRWGCPHTFLSDRGT